MFVCEEWPMRHAVSQRTTVAVAHFGALRSRRQRKHSCTSTVSTPRRWLNDSPKKIRQLANRRRRRWQWRRFAAAAVARRYFRGIFVQRSIFRSKIRFRSPFSFKDPKEICHEIVPMVFSFKDPFSFTKIRRKYAIQLSPPTHPLESPYRC